MPLKFWKYSTLSRRRGPKVSQIKVLVVDDSFFMRKVITDILAGDPEITVVGQAGDGLEALERIEELAPDVVTLDIMMPKLSGFSALQRIVAGEHPPAVLMV